MNGLDSCMLKAMFCEPEALRPRVAAHQYWLTQACVKLPHLMCARQVNITSTMEMLAQRFVATVLLPESTYTTRSNFWVKSGL